MKVSRKRILVRDDRRLVSAVVRIYASALDCEVVEVSSDEQAKQLLKKGTVDLLVADIDETPGALDIASGAWIFDEDSVRRVPAILFSSDPKTVSVSIDLLVLEKPVYRDTFLDAVKKLLGEAVNPAVS